MGSRNITIADVARAAGVSKMTVSKVINNQGSISDATRERILSIINELGYTAHPGARTLKGGRTQTLGLVVPQLHWQYSSEIVRGIDQTAQDAGLDLLISTSQENPQHEARNATRLAKGLVDGLIVLLPTGLPWYSEDLGVPLVVVVPGAGNLPTGLPTIDADHYQGARLAIRHLTDLGHTRIAFLSGGQDAGSLARQRGYWEGLLTQGIPLDPDLEVPGAFQQRQGFVSTQQLLSLPRPPTAIFAANDLSAFGAIEAIKDQGLRVPEDISVVGFDDIPQAHEVHPALTTIRQPLSEMGAAATRQLLGLIDGRGVTTPTLVLPTELIIRNSTAVVRQPQHN